MALAGSEKSYSKLFFVISQILVFLALYSLYDEGVVRRPWKHFQEEFNRLEMQVLEEKYNKVYKKYQADGVHKKIKKLQLEREELVTQKESKEYKKLLAKQTELQIDYDDKVLNVKDDKSLLDALYYEWKHGVLAGHDKEAKEAEKEYKDLDASINKQKEEIEKAKEKFENVKSKVAEYDKKIEVIDEQIASLKKPLGEAQAQIDNVAFRPVEIKQVVIEDLGVQGNIYWNRIDRCETCHVGVNKNGYEDVVKAFGLQVVKDQAAVQAALKKNPDRKGLIITEKQKRHYQIMYGTHPNKEALLGVHKVSEFGCTACHGGEGRALQIKHMAFGPYTGSEEEIKEAEILGSDSEYVSGVLRHKDLTHATHHHGIEPVLRGGQMESSCLGCHQGEIYIPEAEKLTKGLQLFTNLGCNGCHLVEGYSELFKVGPSLEKVGEKVDQTWLVDWIKNPKNYMPNSRMPMFGLTDDEVVAVSSYLLSKSKGYQPVNTNMSSGNIENGEKLFKQIGCQGCHSADDSEKTYATRSRAPNLARLSAKIKSASWVFDWIKDPKNYAKHARMPSLRLTDGEASDITAYLMSQNSDYKNEIQKRSGALAAKIDSNDQDLVNHGAKIIKKRGCYACHSIEGTDGMDRIGPQLTTEALKETLEFDFGDALAKDFQFKDVFGKNIYVGHSLERPGEETSHILKRVKKPENADSKTNLEETWQSWIRNKLRYPLSIYNHERAELKMPNFDLKDDELDALTVFLKALQGRKVPSKFNASERPWMQNVIAGQKLVAQYNCLGCHEVQGYGGDINPHIDVEKGSKLTQYYPPSLDWVGVKIRPEWLYNFLENPEPYRPQVNVRMPTFKFSNDELNTLMKYFAGLTKVDPKMTQAKYNLIHENIEVSKVLAGPEAYNCFSCHLQNGKTPGDNPDNYAPDWADMGERLQYDFIVEWIKNPAKYQSHAVMPGFLKSDDEAHPDYLDGKSEEQLKALRDFILSFHKDKVITKADKNAASE